MLPRRSSVCSHSDVNSWRRTVEIALHESGEDDEQEFYLKANDVGSAAEALIEFIISHYSNGTNLPRARQRALNVTIRPHSSIQGLFFSKYVTIVVCVDFLLDFTEPDKYLVAKALVKVLFEQCLNMQSRI